MLRLYLLFHTILYFSDGFGIEEMIVVDPSVIVANDEYLPCEYCEYAAFSYEELNAHKQLIHFGISFAQNPQNEIEENDEHERELYPCERGYSATEPDERTQHVHAKNNNIGTRYSYDMCPHEATRSDNMNSHKEVKHKNMPDAATNEDEQASNRNPDIEKVIFYYFSTQQDFFALEYYEYIRPF